eukprot:6160248-Pyramimonas_sp.AAC.2
MRPPSITHKKVLTKPTIKMTGWSIRMTVATVCRLFQSGGLPPGDKALKRRQAPGEDKAAGRAEGTPNEGKGYTYIFTATVLLELRTPSMRCMRKNLCIDDDCEGCVVDRDKTRLPGTAGQHPVPFLDA